MVKEQAERMMGAAAVKDGGSVQQQEVKEDAAVKDDKAADAKAPAQDGSTKEYINQQIASLSKNIKVDQQKIQSQMSDVKNQVDQVARKIGFLENAINEMKEAREGFANDQERLKDDIYNMLFDQKH